MKVLIDRAKIGSSSPFGYEIPMEIGLLFGAEALKYVEPWDAREKNRIQKRVISSLLRMRNLSRWRSLFCGYDIICFAPTPLMSL